jgi:hypothetical protein
MWEWMQDDGSGPRRVISDRPPPAHLKNIRILRQPQGAAVAAPQGPVAVPALAPPGTAAQPAAGNLPVLPSEDKNLAARKKQAEEAEAEKQRAAQEAAAKIRADNCARAQSVKATLDSGQRIAITGTNGERVVLDDDGRAAEMRRVQAAMQQNCR